MLLQTVEFFFFAVLMFLTTIVFAIMSLFYNYANGSSNTHETADADNLHLTARAEPATSDSPKESASEQQ